MTDSSASRERRVSDGFTSLLGSHPVGQIAGKNLLKFNGDDLLRNVIDELVKRNVLSAPVFDGDVCLGLLDWNDITHYAITLIDKVSLNNGKPDKAELVSADKQFFTTKARDLVDYSHRNPFVPVDENTSLLAAIEKLGTGIHRIPLRAKEDGHVIAVVSQSDIVHLLEKNIKLLGSLGDETVAGLGLNKGDVISVPSTGIALDAFRSMKQHNIGSVAVLDEEKTLVGAVTVSDLQGIVETHSMSVLFTPIPKFISLVRMMNVEDKVPTIDCKTTAAFKTVVLKLAATKVHRLFVVTDSNHCAGIITLTDVLKVLTRSLH